MNISIAQQNYHVGNVAYNTEKIIVAIVEAKKQKTDLLIFSELAVCGYPPHDKLFASDFFVTLQQYLKKIIAQTSSITIVIGVPRKNKEHQIFNSAVVISNKKIIATIDKTLLPEYDVFNERRYFSPAEQWQSVRIKNKNFAITICEDIWFDDKKYAFCPLQKITQKNKIDAIVNLSASPFDTTHLQERVRVLQQSVAKYKVPIFYANAVGTQTDLIFDGNSIVMNKQSQVICKGKRFEEDLIHVQWNELESTRPITVNTMSKKTNCIVKLTEQKGIENIYHALVLGIRDYVTKSGFQKVILGASGGIDSAVVQALATAALGEKNVLAILMPSKFSSEHSIADAKKLSENLGNDFFIAPINNEYDSFLNSLQPLFKQSKFSVAEENMQSRIRGNMLMTIANKYNYLLLNTSNKSELAMGYGTLYGDMAGAVSVLGDLFKTQVFALARFINEKKIIIPKNILTKAPSAELRPNQKDSDSLPEYEVLDELLHYFIHEQKSCEQIQKMKKWDDALVAKTFRTLHLNEYKRFQFCPILRISNKSFGRGRKIEVVGF